MLSTVGKLLVWEGPRGQPEEAAAAAGSGGSHREVVAAGAVKYPPLLDIHTPSDQNTTFHRVERPALALKGCAGACGAMLRADTWESDLL